VLGEVSGEQVEAEDLEAMEVVEEIGRTMGFGAIGAMEQEVLEDDDEAFP
jgi:hypothetical protein